MDNDDKIAIINGWIKKIFFKRKNDVIEHLKRFGEELELDGNGLKYVTVDDFYNEIIDNNVNDNQLLELTDRGIRILNLSQEMYDILRDYISKNISKLTVASRFINSKLLKDFPNLREVTANDVEDFESTKGKIIKLDIPEEGELAKKFQKYFVVHYVPPIVRNKNVFNFIHLYDREESNGPVFFGKLSSTRVFDGISIASSKIEKIILMFEWLEMNNCKVNNVILKLENKSYDDIEQLRKYTSKFSIKIACGEDRDLTYEEFLTMRSTIDWYKELLNSSELSPFEKTIFAYDILKTFEYKDDINNGDNSSIVPDILRTGNIVCVGYSKLLAELLNEVGINAFTYVIPSIEEGENAHMRVCVKIDDDKYDIHGMYSLDATWDSVKKTLRLSKNNEGYTLRSDEMMEDETIVKKYNDALALYTNFMIPYDDYKELYPRESLPYFFRIIEDNDYIFDDILQKIFGKMPVEEIRKYIVHSRKPTLSEFSEALRIVRNAEGYGNLWATSIFDLIELNRMLDDAIGSHKTFFSDENTNSK